MTGKPVAGVSDDDAPGVSPLPSPTLPRGGAAAHGLGETVSVDPHTGSCSVSIPLAVSRGRGAGHVELSLAYGAGAGRSPFGLHWSVHVPSVTRSTRRGVPTYTDADTYTLDGAELVPVLVPGAGGLVEYDKPAVVDGANVRIRRFRARLDAASTRVEQIRDPVTGEAYWRTVTRDDVTTVFGRTLASRVADPAAQDRRVSEWLADEVRDSLGNVTVYTYKPEDAARYLKSIRYGNDVPGDGTSGRLLVLFDYGEHDESPAEAQVWPARQDPYRTHTSGFEVVIRRLCRRVMVFHDFPELGPGPSPRLVRTVDLGHDENPMATTLRSVEQTGYDWDGAAYVSAALPPVEIAYYPGTPDLTVRTVELPGVREAGQVRWLDLDGDGLPGVLFRDAGAWWYARPAGDGLFDPPRPVDLPVSGRTEGPPDLADVDGSGRQSAVADGPGLAGTATRVDGKWSAWRPYRHRPVDDLASLESRDVDGDGLGDLVRSGPDDLAWRRSLGRDGYAPAVTVRRPADERDGPRPPFRDTGNAWFDADLTGDGAADLVRVRNGSIDYWPAAGRGRYGARVTMAHAPLFDHPDQFDPARIRFADLDGTGCADLIYLGHGAVVLWRNESGNAWGPATVVTPFPMVSGDGEVEVVDLLGKGTPCLVWTTPRSRTAHYFDLCAGFGHAGALRSVTNNLGRRTEVEYASSTSYAIAARRAANPWRTRLSGPVSVVARLVEHDDVAAATHLTRYTYRDGWYDPTEREFRGFGIVDVSDADDFAPPPPGTVAYDPPPARTRHWFHQGGPDAEPTGTFADPLAQPLAGHEIAGIAGGREYREAIRALAGLPLRVETYGDDGVSANPYTVVAHRHRVVRLQPARGDRPAVYRTEPLETVEHHYERTAADPRVTHDLTLATDPYGTVLSSVRVAYPRRAPAIPEQVRPLVSWALVEVANTDDAQTLRLGVVVAQREYQVTALAVPPNGRYDLAALRATLPGLPELAFEETPAPFVAQRRLVSAALLEYWRDDLAAAAPQGQPGRRALLRRTRSLALTTGLLANVFGAEVGPGTLAEGGYQNGPGGWWIDDGITHYDAAAFYQPTRWESFGNTATVTYDAYGLLVVATRASATAPYDRNATVVRPDYRVLAPDRVTDPHGTENTAEFDPHGRVVRSWLTAADGSGDPVALPGAVHAYDSRAWFEGRGPAWAQTDAREVHADAASRWQRQRVFTDGAGRIVMTKTQAEPGLALADDGAGGTVLVDTTPGVRWVGTGRTVFAKALPVEQYEPYFSATPDFESADALVKHEVSELRTYDPLGRVIRIDHADGSYERYEFGPWHETAYDRNDTVLDSRWYADRQQVGTPAAEVRAATLAAAHANTPLASLTDPLGRVVRTRADNGAAGTYETTRHLDLDGHPVRMDDALGRVIVTQVHDAAGRIVATTSPDAGQQRALAAADGRTIRQWGANGHKLRCGYDLLRRRTHLFVTDPGAGGARLAEYTVYGETHPQADARFLVGRVHRRYDEAGLSRADEHDLAGNLVAGARVLLAGTAEPDWTALDGVPLAGLDAAGAALLGEELGATSAFDAMAKPVRQEMADGTVLTLAYNAGGLLDTVTASPAGNTDVVLGIEYDARRRRTKIEHGNGITTRYGYEGATSKLRALSSTGGAAGAVQDVTYTYDPMGNPVQIDDTTQQAVFFAGAVVSPSSLFEYDALYRLVSATGREHASLGTQPDHDEPAIRGVPHPHDANALRAYTETYDYDAVGNILSVAHAAGPQSWTRPYAYVAGTNRLLAHGLAGDPVGGPFTATFDHDAAGNMTRMPHLAAMAWDHGGALRTVDRGGGGVMTFHRDAAGHRVRKIWQRNGGLREETLYLGDHEVYRRYLNDVLVFERRTAHVNDGRRRILTIETVTVDTDNPVFDGAPLFRYQYADHLGSSAVECDAAGAVLSYEEYHPYGTTSLWLARGAAAVSTKRYRYNTKEKDETGLYFYGARYYVPWLGRWTAPDPAGLSDGANRYAYVNGNPVRHVDPTGLSGVTPEQMWFVESKAFEFQRMATATDRGFSKGVYDYAAAEVKLWGGPAKYHLSHQDKPFALLKPGESSGIRIESEKANLGRVAEEKKMIDAARKAGVPVRDSKTGLYPGATKGARVGQAPLPKVKVIDTASGQTVALKPSKVLPAKPPPSAAVKPPVVTPPVKAPAVKAPEQLDLFNQPPKTPPPKTPPPTTPPATPPATVASDAAKAETTVAKTEATVAKAVKTESTVTKLEASVAKVTTAVKSEAGLAKVEAGLAKATKTGADLAAKVAPVVKSAAPVVKEAGALSKTVATGTKVLKAVAPVVKVAAPALKVIGAVAKPLTVGIAAVELATANNNTERLVAAGDLAAGAAAYGGPVGVAFSVGYTAGGLLDKGIEKASKATVGVDLSPSNIMSHGMTNTDQLISKVIPDSPDKPAYKNENKVAWFLIDTLGF